jgi:hypothetical protein
MTITDELRRRIRQSANSQCGYCRVPAQHIYGFMEIEHILPKAAGGTDEEANLWLACSRCNTYKGAQTHALDEITNQVVALFNPRFQNWSQHFQWGEDRATILGKTPIGRATVVALNLNLEEAVEFRRLLVSIGWSPTTDD